MLTRGFRPAGAVVALAAASALLLSACSGPSPSPVPTPTPASFTAHQCAADATSANALKVGAILPITGSAYLGGAAQLAAINLALADVNAAGGVTGKSACLVAIDSVNGFDAAGASAAANSLVAQQPSVILTALNNEASAAVIAATAAAAVPVISLTSTSSALSSTSNTFFRAAAPEWAQAQALTQTLIVDGNPKIAIIGSTDAASVAYRTQLTDVFTAEKGLVLFGGIPATPAPVATAIPTATPKPITTPVPEAFTPGQTDFAPQVSAALATNPNAVVIVATAETPAIVTELMKQGWKMPKTYFADSNVVSYSGTFANGALLGAQGTIPGQSPSAQLQAKLVEWTFKVRATGLKSVNYAAEAYDATMLAALAATRYARTDPYSVSINLLAVSGTYGGDRCDEFSSCAAILDKNLNITYRGPSSMGPFTGAREVSSAMVSIYQYNNENVPIWTGVQSIRSVKEPKR